MSRQALKALLPFDMQRRLEAEAPTHFETPAGSRIALDYAAEGGPTLSVRVQELYGLANHPALARGKAALTLELLSPASRPIQITQEFAGLLARLLGVGEGRNEGPLSAPSLARRSRRGGANDAGEAAGKLTRRCCSARLCPPPDA